MQTQVRTAGETAIPYNSFEEEIIRLNNERDGKLNEICIREQQLTDERQALKQQKTEHHQAIVAINNRIDELKEAIRGCENEKNELRAETNRRKAKVMEEADAWYSQHPSENWLWKKVYRFFKKHPDQCIQIMREEGGEL